MLFGFSIRKHWPRKGRKLESAHYWIWPAQHTKCLDRSEIPFFLTKDRGGTWGLTLNECLGFYLLTGIMKARSKHPLLLCSSMAGIFYCSLQQVGRGGNGRTHPLAAWLRRVYNTQSSASVCIGVGTMSSFPVFSQWTLDWDLSLKTGLHSFFLT